MMIFIINNNRTLMEAPSKHQGNSRKTARATTPRVVVTGLGLVSPLGCGAEFAWQRLLEGRSGVRRLHDDLCSDLPAKIAGLVPERASNQEGGFDPATVADAKDMRRMDRFIVMALEAARQAAEHSAWTARSEAEACVTATIIASGVGGFSSLSEAVRTTDSRGPGRLSPFTVPSFLVNLAAGHVSIRHGFKGPIGAPATACAASLQAIGEGLRLIRSGEAQVAFCGGSEAAIHRVSLGGFAAAKTLSTRYNDAPHLASRPFDTDRDGFVLGEGAGMLVLESLEHAIARGATPLAEIVGYGTTADAHHITSGPEDGDGAYRSMQAALRMAGMLPGEVDHLNAHATSTQVGDRAELAAIRRLFAGARGPAISATKSATGHLLGAAGALASIFSILALRDQIAPPTLNLVSADEGAADLDLVRTAPRPMPLTTAMVNGFGFGGVNATLLIKKMAR
jgi:3-oxoacyl-[acyl-carrier-protein] synthase II